LTSRAFRRSGWNLVGVALFAVMVFPVFWMISTAFKPDDQINSLTPTWFSRSPTLHHFTDAIHTPFFWSSVKNSVIIEPTRLIVTLTSASSRAPSSPACSRADSISKRL